MKKIAVIGLGYVGLPLALQFAKHFHTVGYDVSQEKIAAYRNFVDPSNEVTAEDFEAATMFFPTTNINYVSAADYIIIAMPTPVDENNLPDFTCLQSASLMVGQVMKTGATVIYESTVYPGATEEVCIPILETMSGKKWKEDFFVGYSPERISPGDKVRPLVKLKKIVSGDTRETLGNVAELYETIIEAGVYCAPSIRVAEAAKVVENIQRDVNIALMNELATIFHKLDLDTNEVLDAAASKWNFTDYRPGLVGGHCIGVDPYYLIHKASTVNHSAGFITHTREVNNAMPEFVVRETLKNVEDLQGLTVAVLGVAFKENCKDIRNSKVFELIAEYEKAGCTVYAHDPIVSADEVKHEYGVDLVHFDDLPVCDLVVLASPHNELVYMPFVKMLGLIHSNGIFVDIKGKVDTDHFDNTNITLWRL